jgi:tRNA(Ile)-lysidine synthase
VTQSFDDAIAVFAPVLPVAVAYSGGADSTALLLACAERWPGQVSAIHVHHGLQAAADEFQRHCEATCTRLSVPLVVKAVDARHASGQSPEEAARAARYQAFKNAVIPVEYKKLAIQSIALAQHADDQVETMLLALSRGAGLAGLAAMPANWQRDGIQYHRPLLGVSAVQIRQWLAERGEGFVEDPTNADEQFTRNRIRAQLLPTLESVFPHFRDTFARSASHAAQAQGLVNERAQGDLVAILAHEDSAALHIGKLQQISRARQANVIRYWLKTHFKTTPSTAQLNELLDQLAVCTTRGHQIRIKVGAGFAQRQGAKLAWYNP